MGLKDMCLKPRIHKGYIKTHKSKGKFQGLYIHIHIVVSKAYSGSPRVDLGLAQAEHVLGGLGELLVQKS